MKITHQNIAIVHTYLGIDAAHHTNRIMGQGDEEVGMMFLQESGNIFLLLVSSDTSSSVAACAAIFIVLQLDVRKF